MIDEKKGSFTEIYKAIREKDETFFSRECIYGTYYHICPAGAVEKILGK